MFVQDDIRLISYSIIVVPEISDLGVECAPNHWMWLNQAIKHCSSSSEVLFWEHNYGQRKFMWDDLRRQSHELLNSILKQDKAVRFLSTLATEDCCLHHA